MDEHIIFLDRLTGFVASTACLYCLFSGMLTSVRSSSLCGSALVWKPAVLLCRPVGGWLRAADRAARLLHARHPAVLPQAPGHAPGGSIRSAQHHQGGVGRCRQRRRLHYRPHPQAHFISMLDRDFGKQMLTPLELCREWLAWAMAKNCIDRQLRRHLPAPTMVPALPSCLSLVPTTTMPTPFPPFTIVLSNPAKHFLLRLKAPELPFDTWTLAHRVVRLTDSCDAGKQIILCSPTLPLSFLQTLCAQKSITSSLKPPTWPEADLIPVFRSPNSPKPTLAMVNTPVPDPMPAKVGLVASKPPVAELQPTIAGSRKTPRRSSKSVLLARIAPLASSWPATKSGRGLKLYTLPQALAAAKKTAPDSSATVSTWIFVFMKEELNPENVWQWSGPGLRPAADQRGR